MPEIADIFALPAAPIGAMVADFCAVLAELHMESRQAIIRVQLAQPNSPQNGSERGFGREGLSWATASGISGL
jgi:hypothetical protein